MNLCSSWQVLDRGEKIELLVDKTENLRSQVCNTMNFAGSWFVNNATLLTQKSRTGLERLSAELGLQI